MYSNDNNDNNDVNSIINNNDSAIDNDKKNYNSNDNSVNNGGGDGSRGDNSCYSNSGNNDNSSFSSDSGDKTSCGGNGSGDNAGCGNNEEINEKSFITQVGEGFECKEIFEILEKLRNAEKDKEYEERSNKSKIFNRFSGTYFSPTFVKGFSECPARFFINSCTPRKTNEVTNLGSCTHKVFERIVREKTYYDEEKSFAIVREEAANFNISPPNQKLLEERYTFNFLNAEDYCHPGEPFPWDRVEMFPEQFFKDDLSVFGIPLGPCFTLMDRLDIRDEGIFIIDYKTGSAPRNSERYAEFVASYTNQFIVYNWQIEKQYGIPATGAFAFLPDNNHNVEMPIHSLKLQSMMVEDIIKHYESIKEQREKLYFRENVNKYCKYCSIKDICNAFNKKNDRVVLPFDLSII